MAESTPEPVPNELWSCNGFTFRIDAVIDNEVFVVKFRDGIDVGTPIRVDLSVWEDEIKSFGGVRQSPAVEATR